jgi:hypothetical protein
MSRNTQSSMPPRADAAPLDGEPDESDDAMSGEDARTPLAAILPHGLREALADLDENFEFIRMGNPDDPLVDRLHAWARDRVMREYAMGLVPPRRAGRALPPVAGRRARSRAEKPRRGIEE